MQDFKLTVNRGWVDGKGGQLVVSCVGMERQQDTVSVMTPPLLMVDWIVLATARNRNSVT